MDTKLGYETWLRNLDSAERKPDRKAERKAEWKAERKAERKAVTGRNHRITKLGFLTWTPYLGAKPGYETWMRNLGTKPGYETRIQRIRTENANNAFGVCC